MMQDFLITLVLAFVTFELIEHVVVPIAWFLLKRKKKFNYGNGGMKGKTVKIQSWDDKSGIVLFNTERWRAVSDKPMQAGEKAIVEDISGLTLKIKPYIDTPEN